jgi:hypothetical protein
MIDDTTVRTVEQALPTLVRAVLEQPVPPDVAERRLAQALALARLAAQLATEPPERGLELLDEGLPTVVRGERIGDRSAVRELLGRLQERVCDLLRAGQSLASAVETALREFFDEIRQLLGALAAGAVAAAVAPGLAKLLLAALVAYLVAEVYQAVTAGLCGPLPVPPSPPPPQPEPAPGT